MITNWLLRCRVIKMVDKNKVKEDAKQIMEGFMKELGKAEVETGFKLERQKFLREEKEPYKEEGFKERFLENAPQRTSEHVLSEKGDWEK